VRVTSRSRPFTRTDAHYPPTWGIDGTITARCAEFSVGAEIYAFGWYGRPQSFSLDPVEALLSLQA
jgi:hypothetical protein